MVKRFDIIIDCNGNTDLIDRKNELIAIPLKYDYDVLSDEDKKRLKEWLNFLNKGEKDTIQTTLTISLRSRASTRNILIS